MSLFDWIYIQLLWSAFWLPSVIFIVCVIAGAYVVVKILRKKT